MGPQSRLPGYTWVVLRGWKVIRCLTCAVFRHKTYAFCFVLVLTPVVLTWHYYFVDWIFDESLLYTCANETNSQFESAPELEKTINSAASTLLTLLPALLVFAPFPTARISSLIIFSTWASLLTAGFTLGLATSSVSTLPKKKIFKVHDLCTEATIETYRANLEPGRALHELYTNPGLGDVALGDGSTIGSSIAPEVAPMMIGAAFQTRRGNPLLEVMARAMTENTRPTRIVISVKTFGFFLIQVSLLYSLVMVIPNIFWIDVIWLCPGLRNYLVVGWVGITAVLAAFIRTYSESVRFSKLEILHLSPLPPSFFFNPWNNRTHPTTPLPPVVEPEAICEFEPPTSNRSGSIPSLPRRLWTAQTSHHGMVVVLRPSVNDDGKLGGTKQLLHGVLYGLTQAILLILLTVLFCSIYSSTILLSLLFLLGVMALMVASRTYSIYFCSWMERVLDTIQIEYDTPDELAAIRTILSGMPSMFVRNMTLRRTHAAGNCLTPNDRCANQISCITGPLPPPAQIMAIAFALLTVSVWWWGMWIVWYLSDRGRDVIWIRFLCFIGPLVIIFVTNKLYHDWDFIRTQEGGVSSEGIPTV